MMTRLVMVWIEIASFGRGVGWDGAGVVDGV